MILNEVVPKWMSTFQEEFQEIKSISHFLSITYFSSAEKLIS